MYKNRANQKLYVWARTSAYAAVVDDQANITCQISKDGGSAAASNDTNPTQLDSTNMPGIYYFDLTQAETNCDEFVAVPVSATGTTIIKPVIIYTDRLPGATRSYFRK